MSVIQFTISQCISLREDLQYWVLQHEKATVVEGAEDPDAIRDVIESVNGQQVKILVSLLDEQRTLEQELSTGSVVIGFHVLPLLHSIE